MSDVVPAQYGVIPYGASRYGFGDFSGDFLNVLQQRVGILAPMFESFLRTDLLNEELLESPEKIKAFAESQFNIQINNTADEPRTTTPGNSKNIIEVMELIREAVLDYETRTHTTEDGKINVVYERPDVDMDVETVTIGFYSRGPGAFSQGRPMEGSVKNRRPILREVVEDPDNPGYKRAVLGYYYDNIIRITAWARTNKQANIRALWIENLMEEYTWFFTLKGVNRILFDGCRQNEIIKEGNNIRYGRPMDYFVRTEKLWNLSQKTLEEICIRLAPVSHTT